MRTYTELIRLETFEDRFEYLRLDGIVAATTFGGERWANQRFYHSREWRQVRNHVIARDLGWDIGHEDFVIRGNPQIHHMNPLTIDDLVEATENMLDPEFLISVSHNTHNAVHYGDRSHLPRRPAARTPGDTKLW